MVDVRYEIEDGSGNERDRRHNAPPHLPIALGPLPQTVILSSLSDSKISAKLIWDDIALAATHSVSIFRFQTRLRLVSHTRARIAHTWTRLSPVPVAQYALAPLYSFCTPQTTLPTTNLISPFDHNDRILHPQQSFLFGAFRSGMGSRYSSHYWIPRGTISSGWDGALLCLKGLICRKNVLQLFLRMNPISMDLLGVLQIGRIKLVPRRMQAGISSMRMISFPSHMAIRR